MPDPVVIVAARRTPIGSFQGGLAPLSAVELGAAANRAALADSTVAAAEISEVLTGCVLPGRPEQFDGGQPTRQDSAACLLYASGAAVNVALEAIQTLGGNGYINEYPTGRLLRDAKLYEIGAGTTEIRRLLIGRELFRATGQ